MSDKLLIDLSRIKDTHEKLKLGKELIEYFSNEDGYKSRGFFNFGSFVGGIAEWLNASSLQVNLMAMRLLSVIMAQVKTDFLIHINTILDPLVNKLGDAKTKNRHAAHSALLQLLDDCTDHPQNLLDRIMDTCLLHRNILMKQQGVLFLIKALNFFEPGTIDCKKYVGQISRLTMDSSNKVREAAVLGLVDLYAFAGHEIRDEIEKISLPGPKLKMLNKKFDSIEMSDLARKNSSKLQRYLHMNNSSGISIHRSSIEENISIGSIKSEVRSKHEPNVRLKKHTRNKSLALSSLQDPPSQAQSDSSCGEVLGSVHTVTDMHRTNTGDAAYERNSRRALPFSEGYTTTSRRHEVRSPSPGTLVEEDFERAFCDVRQVQFRNKHELVSKIHNISDCLRNNELHWEVRLKSLQQIRGIFCFSNTMKDKELFGMVLGDVENCLLISLKDLRSHFIKETCITISFICKVLRLRAASFAGVMMADLIPHLSNTARIIASSAEICITYIIKYTLTPILLNHLSIIGFTSKSDIIRSYSAKFLLMILTHNDIRQLIKHVHLIEYLLVLSIRDADPTTRKYGRQAYWKYYEQFPENAIAMLEAFTNKEQIYIDQERPYGVDPIATRHVKDCSTTSRPFPYLHRAVDDSGADKASLLYSYTKCPIGPTFTGIIPEYDNPPLQEEFLQHKDEKRTLEELNADKSSRESDYGQRVLETGFFRCRNDTPMPEKLNTSSSSTTLLDQHKEYLTSEADHNSRYLRAVNTQRAPRARNVGVQMHAIKKDTMIQHQCRSTNKKIQVNSSPLVLQSNHDQIIQLNAFELEIFLEKLLGEISRRGAGKKPTFGPDQVKAILEAHVNKISLNQKKTGKSNLSTYETNLPYQESDDIDLQNSFLSARTSDITPPPPSPSSSLKSISLPKSVHRGRHSMSRPMQSTSCEVLLSSPQSRTDTSNGRPGVIVSSGFMQKLPESLNRCTRKNQTPIIMTFQTQKDYCMAHDHSSDSDDCMD